MGWVAFVRIVGQVLVLAGVVLAMAYSRGGKKNEPVSKHLDSVSLKTRRWLVRIGFVLALLGLTAQFAGGLNLTMWG